MRRGTVVTEKADDRTEDDRTEREQDRAERRTGRERFGAWPAVRPWITTAARLGLAGVLGYAGWAKFTEPPSLQKAAVEAYQLLPDGMIAPVGIGLPILEMVLAALLVAGFATRFTAIFGGLLMVIFIGGIASAWARGLKIDCGCFGGGGTTTADPHYLREIFRDTGFLALAAWVAVWPPGKFAVDRLLGLHED